MFHTTSHDPLLVILYRGRRDALLWLLFWNVRTKNDRFYFYFALKSSLGLYVLAAALSDSSMRNTF